MSTCSIKFLGTSDGLPSDDRNHASMLVDLGERKYLFDCGEPVSRTLKRAGISYDAFDRIFLSHLHADHCGGFQMLVQACWLENRRKPLLVHLPAEGIQPFKAILRSIYLFDDLLPFPLKMLPLKEGEAIRDGKVTIAPYPTTHLQSLKRDFGKRLKAAFEAFSFTVSVGDNIRLGYSADIGNPVDLAPLVAKPLDVLVVELAHFKDRSLFDYLSDKPIKKVILTHIGRRYWKNPQLRRNARRWLKGTPVILAEDGMKVTF